MGVLVVGSVALDSVRTPFGGKDEILGGSATYFGISASYFTDVSVVAVVGSDFPDAHVSFLQRRKIDVSGLERQQGKTFRWKGEYELDLNTRRTLDTQLNVFADFSPKLSSSHCGHEYVFLGNIDPDLQRAVLAQMKRPRFTACDTMNYWIEKKRDSLLKTLALVDCLVINEDETRQLAGEYNLVRAARSILALGPRILVVKRGEYGAVMFNCDSVFCAPAYPIEEVIDPTGAGDTFAGGLVGYLAASGRCHDATLRKGVVFGSVMASFNVSEFGPLRLGELTGPEIEARYREFCQLAVFEGLSEEASSQAVGKV